MVNFRFFLEQKCEEINAWENQQLYTLYEEYDNLDEPNLSVLLAAMHKRFNVLFEFMFDKQKINGHFNADQSRDLLRLIDIYENVKAVSKQCGFELEILCKDYEILISKCKMFLSASGGSAIPEDVQKFLLVDYEPIFSFVPCDAVKIKNDIMRCELKVIGEGSYAIVSVYTDSRYGKKFVVKKAKRDLDDKELHRFKREYEILKQLHSPYFIEVYSYDETRKEYLMEYGGDTVGAFVDRNNDKLCVDDRKRIVWQIFSALEYLHSKNLLHRDISLSNILVQKYEDCIIVKICDLGLVKEQNSDLTSTNSEIKGSLNDSNLAFIGFGKYDIRYETFALTRLIYFIMTGRRNMESIADKYRKFIERGINSDINKRFGDIAEMRRAFNQVEW